MAPRHPPAGHDDAQDPPFEQLFTSLRDSNTLQGKCGICELRDLCGGSRERAWSATGDVFGSDPLCGYQPLVA